MELGKREVDRGSPGRGSSGGGSLGRGRKGAQKEGEWTQLLLVTLINLDSNASIQDSEARKGRSSRSG